MHSSIQTSSILCLGSNTTTFGAVAPLPHSLHTCLFCLVPPSDVWTELIRREREKKEEEKEEEIWFIFNIQQVSAVTILCQFLLVHGISSCLLLQEHFLALFVPFHCLAFLLWRCHVMCLLPLYCLLHVSMSYLKPVFCFIFYTRFTSVLKLFLTPVSSTHAKCEGFPHQAILQFSVDTN